MEQDTKNKVSHAVKNTIIIALLAIIIIIINVRQVKPSYNKNSIKFGYEMGILSYTSSFNAVIKISDQDRKILEDQLKMAQKRDSIIFQLLP